MTIRTGLSIIVLYLAYCCLLFVLQRRIIFPRHIIGTPAKPVIHLPGLEEMWLRTNYGNVEAWFLPAAGLAPGQTAPAVIFAHGNAELIDFWPVELKRFSSHGVGLLLVEYPGYGRSEGTPSEKSITDAFLTAYDVLVERKDVDTSRIVLFGRSLGGGAVCALAARRPSAGLILMSTFTSVNSFARRFLVPDLLVRDHFDNLSVVKAYPNPILVIHGMRDSIIPHAHGKRLYGAAKNGDMVTYKCDHNDCPPNWDVFWRDVEAFLVGAGIIDASTRDGHE